MFNNLEVIRMNSMDAIKAHPDLEAEMIFVDAGHTYPEVTLDLEAYELRAKKIICGHDYSSRFPQVMSAVNDYFKEKGWKVKSYETIWWVNKESVS